MGDVENSFSLMKPVSDCFPRSGIGGSSLARKKPGVQIPLPPPKDLSQKSFCLVTERSWGAFRPAAKGYGGALCGPSQLKHEIAIAGYGPESTPLLGRMTPLCDQSAEGGASETATPEVFSSAAGAPPSSPRP